MNTLSGFEFLDQLRRLQGNALDYVGLGPKESAYDVVLALPGLRLRRYRMDATSGPPLLIVPAPIKRPYIWDISPERSVVRRAIAHQVEVYLVEWTEPGAASPGLADYAGPMLDACMATVTQLSQCDKVFLAGHSLGGVFAALHSAYRPRQVAGLALIDVPLHFPATAGAMRKRRAPGARSSACLPGSFLSLTSAGAAPGTFCTGRYLDRIASMGSRAQMATHWRVERWTMDELPMSRKLFDDVAERLYGQDGFMRGELSIGGKALAPRDIVAPLLTVYHPSSTLISSEAALALHQTAGSADKELVPYGGDVGVALQHVGPLVGDSAFLHVWPRVFHWLARVSRCAASGRPPG